MIKRFLLFKIQGKDVGAGYLLMLEDLQMKKLIDSKRPFTAILGGAKVSDRIGAIYGN